MFQQKRAPKKRRKKNSPNESQSEDSLGSESESDMVWGKVVNPSLRKWIVTLECHRDITDRYFQNPGKRKSEFISSAAAYGRHTYCDLQSHWVIAATVVLQEKLQLLLTEHKHPITQTASLALTLLPPSSLTPTASVQ